MNRIPPRQKIGRKFEQLMNQGLDGEEDITSMVVRLGIERVVQEMLEQEVADYLERGHYQRRRPEQEHRGYRNGYEPGRVVFDNGGPAEGTPATMPETGGALAFAPWAVTALAGLAALGTGMALRRRKR